MGYYSNNKFLNITRGVDKLVNTGLKVGLAFGVAKFAKKKGQQADMLAADKLEIKKMELELQKQELQRKMNENAGISQELPQPKKVEHSTSQSQNKLIEYYNMLQAGAISQEEYNQLKKQTLGI